MSLKTKAKTSATITITIAIILFSCNAWDDYKAHYRDSIRSVEIENVEKLKNCKTPKNGYKTYQCPKCGKKKYVPFTCKCRLCTSCGTKAANDWADRIHHILLKVPHRHVVFTVPDKMRELLVIVHDAGNEFLIDDICTDAKGVAQIPEFPSILLPVVAALGIMLLMSRRRKG